MKQSTVAIIGTGAVGSTTAYALILQHVVSKIMLIDIDSKRCKGEVQDLSDALPFGGAAQVVQATAQEAGQADIIIIAAGVPQKPGQTRTELLATNRAIVTDIIHGMQPINPLSIIVMVTNPVDVLTYHVQAISGLPRNQIFGSGTMLDSQRLRGLIGQQLHIAQQSIHAYILGEHGDSQVVAWSSAQIGGISIDQFPELKREDLQHVAQAARQKAYDIIACKGATSFGVAACISVYCQNVLFDNKRIMPVSCYLEEYDICMSMPAVIGKQGVERILRPPLNDREQKQLAASAAVLRAMV